MGASRHVQRHQEHTQRRITRSEPPTREEALAGMDREYTELVDDYAAAAQTIRALEAERDRLREERDAIARTAAKAGDVIEKVMTERNRLRAALDEIKNWSLMGPEYVNARALIMDILDRHGFGGDQ